LVARDDSVAAAQESRAPESSYLATVARRFVHHRLATIAFGVLLLITLACIFAPFLTPYRPGVPDLSAMLAPPSAKHIMGTNNLGIDEFSMILFGGRISLTIGFMVAVVAILFGGLVGAVSGYFGGWVDNILMRLTDVMLAVPYLFIVLILALLIGATPATITAEIAAFSWMYPARIVRSQVLTLRERDFTEAARAAGARSGRIILREIVPNALAPVIVSATLLVGSAIVVESIIDFLGAGLNPPNISWGWMLNQAQSYIEGAWWMSFFPGFMIFLVVLAVNLMGDGLRDALDPTAKALLRDASPRARSRTRQARGGGASAEVRERASQ
jgi:peptide/nickel transport system permease protein